MQEGHSERIRPSAFWHVVALFSWSDRETEVSVDWCERGERVLFVWEGQRPRCPHVRITGNEDVAPPVLGGEMWAEGTLPLPWTNPAGDEDLDGLIGMFAV